MSQSHWNGLWIVSLLAILPIGSSQVCANEQADLAREVAATLREMKEQGRLRDFDLELNVTGKTVTVTGRVSTPSHARLVMDAILGAGMVEGIVLNIGIGKTPPPLGLGAFPNYGQFYNYGKQLELHRNRKLEWHDGHWDLDFTGNGEIKLQGAKDEKKR